MIRVLHCVVGMNYGGYETFIMNVYRNIDRTKIQFDFLTSLPGVFDKEIEEMGGIVYRVPFITKVGPFAYQKNLDTFFRLHPEYDIVHSHMDKFSGSIMKASKKAGVKTRIAHSHNTQNEGGIAYHLVKNFYSVMIEPNCTHRFACSQEAADWMFGEKGKEAIVVYNGIEVAKYFPDNEKRNEIRKELGLENTHFTNPHGLDDENHYTTARELSKIAVAAMKNETFSKIVSTYKKTIPLNETEGVRLLINHNKLLKNYDGAIGIKTGYTKKSGRCLVSSATRDGVNLICVTLSAPDDWKDHTALLDHGFFEYESRLLYKKGEFKYTMPIVGGDKEYVALTNECEMRVTLPKTAPEIKYTVELFPFEYASVSKGDVLGHVVFTSGEKIVAKMPLTAEFSSGRVTYKKSIFDWFISLFNM